MNFKVRLDIGRFRLIWSNDALINGIKFYNKRIGYISLLSWKFLWCFYAKPKPQ